MTTNHELVPFTMETFRRGRRIVAGTFALAMLMPTGATGMDSTPKDTSDRTGYLLPLQPIPPLDSMRWMDWRPSAPLLKVDTLLLRDSTQPGVFRLPSDYERALPRIS